MTRHIIILFLATLTFQQAQAFVCPDPHGSSLQWGEPPAPWVTSPYSAAPQSDATLRFVKANILVAGLGRGISCTYQNAVGRFSIVWEVHSKIPARTQPYWVSTLGGYACSQSIADCSFEVVDE